MPPTIAAFKQHVMRVNYVAHLWNRSTKNITTLNPIEYGWSLDSAGNYQAVMTNENPAPISIIELIKCGCKKGCLGRCTRSVRKKSDRRLNFPPNGTGTRSMGGGVNS